ncbi:hypothetical protein OIU79_007556 [Salix purpurea]|uniref:Endonuclease/exonuclease/phosphatase domain-containing protein n=1 Tax=Salix purpurea TaxID=77065 RepID=A0A9Q0TY54_SALPP|nr:hypothetical protein OIU79_007556 [Salix purpurea]
METKVLSENQKSVERGLKLPHWSYMFNGNDGVASRMMVGWDPRDCHVLCVDRDHQWMTCHIRFLRQDITLTVTFVYGLHTAAERQRIWDYINLHSNLITHAWLLMGDFNATLKASDSVGGDPSWGGCKLDFGNCLAQAQLFSLPYKGPRFTWHNGQDSPNTIVKKLDWAISNQALITAWPLSLVKFNPRSISDHSAMILHLHGNQANAIPPRFKFLNLWTDQEDFLSRISNLWQQPVHGNALFRLTSKLQMVKAHLSNWHRHHRSDISGRVIKAKVIWERAQRVLDDNPLSNSGIFAERLAAKNYQELIRDEEAFYKQKSRIQCS